MGAHPVQVILPEKLAEEIDALVGRDGRSAFLVETAEAEVRRRLGNASQAEEKKKRLQAFLRDDMPAWKDEDHPELADGAYAWVKKMRQGSDRRIPDDGLSGAVTK
jgi:Arc/MetJ-type ribon-helix-helix transcriptional regulator